MTMISLPTDDMKKLMECPICLEIPLYTPILQCATGHSFCTPCRQKLKNCSLCGEQFSTTRNYTVENMIQAARFSCEFKGQGCYKTFSGAEMTRHKKECPFGPVLCNYHRIQSCVNKPIDMGDWADHLVTQHKVLRIKIEQATFALKGWSGLANVPPLVLFVMEMDGKDFLLNRMITATQNYYLWVSFVGQNEDARKHTATISFNPPHEKKGFAKIDFTVSILSFRESFETVKDSGSFAILPREYLESYSSAEVFPSGTYKVYNWHVECRITKTHDAAGVDAKRQKMMI